MGRRFEKEGCPRVSSVKIKGLLKRVPQKLFKMQIRTAFRAVRIFALENERGHPTQSRGRFTAARSVGLNCNTIELEARSSIDVGTESAHSSGLQFVQYFRARMAVAIVQPAGDYRPSRSNASKKFRSR